MNYWWVNQNQTFKYELQGGYLWSPKRRKDGARNQSYEWMRVVRPGDIIFSYANGEIKAIGVAQSSSYDCPKPAEFGRAGAYWGQLGWRVDVYYFQNFSSFRPAEHIDEIREFLPEKYSPLNKKTGRGNQAFYLCAISQALAERLASFTDRWVFELILGRYVLDIPSLAYPWKGQQEWEEYLVSEISRDQFLLETEKDVLLKARVGQGRFRQDLLLKPHAYCLITQVERCEHLVASHIKPWRNSDNDERLDPENGFLLTPSIDHLFDKGFISFENNGRIIPSEVSDVDALAKMGIPLDYSFRTRGFSEGEKSYLDYHRNNILLSVS